MIFTYLLNLKPHNYLDGNAMWIVPEYRNIQASPLLTSKFEAVLDEFDIEGYGECGRMSRGTLGRVGFTALNIMNFPMKVENPTDATRSLIDDFLSEPLYLIWRPRKSDKGKNIVPPSIRL